MIISKVFFSPLLCGFRKGHSTHHALLKILLNWQKSLDNKGVVGAVLMDLSKAFDTLPHDLLIAKLACYGLSKPSLNLIHSFLSHRHQRVKIGDKFSNWKQIGLGVPQGSILGPLLFNIFLNDLFLFILESDICNFADDNTLSSCDLSYYVVKYTLKADAIRALEWFKTNSLVANPEKFQMLILGYNDVENDFFEFANIKIVCSKTVRLLGIDIDNKLNFNSHIDKICKIVNNKTNALVRIRNFVDEEKAHKIAQAYILSQFNYCSLIWMFCSKTANHKIERAHKRVLRVIIQDFSVPFNELLSHFGSKSIHQRNLYSLMSEVYKSQNYLNPIFIREFFTPKVIPYSLRSGSLLKLPQVQGRSYGIYCLQFRAIWSWNNLPKFVKSSESFVIFKTRLRGIQKDGQIYCNCRLCRD